MAKNYSNQKYLQLKDENQKLLETEQRLINEGIIFKSRLLNHKNKSQKPNTKRNNNKKDLSIKLTALNLKKDNNLINSNIPISTKRKKKSSFTNINHLSVSELSKGKNKNKENNQTNINKKMTGNTCTRNIYNHNSHKHSKNNIYKKDSKFAINFDEKNIINSVNISPRISYIKMGNYHKSPSERSKYYLNNINRDIKMKYGQQKFNYNKWNKIIINDIFSKEINNGINQNTNPLNNNNGIIDKITKEYNDKYDNYNNNSYMSGKNKEIQEIVIKNIKNKKQKKTNEIPYNKRKNKCKVKIIERNNIFNYCKQMTSLALTKENNSNFTGQTTKGEKYDIILGTNDFQALKNNFHLNNNNINTNLKQYNKSINKKPYSKNKIDKHSFQSGHQYSFKEIDFKNLSKHNNFNSPKISFELKSKNKSHNYCVNSNNNDQNNIGKKNINNNNKNDLIEFKESSIPILNTQVIRIKNSKLMDYIKSDEANRAKSAKEIVYQKDKNENNEDIKSKNEFCDELFNSNTDLFTEKDKGYTFDNKLEIDNTESTFKIFNNCNNYNLDINNINFSNYNINTTSDLNKNHKSDLPYSLKHSIFSKKITGGVIIKANNKNNIKNNDENINMINKSYKSYSYNNNLKENKIDEKEVIFSNHKIINKKENIIENNSDSKSNGEYMELAKICANQEKIISNLVENVQKLNNQICDKDLYINELNNQLYSIKCDLLNTLQKTKNNK